MLKNFNPKHKLRIVQKYQTVDNNGKTIFHCSSCNYQSLNPKFIIDHIEKHNLMISSYECGDCNFTRDTRAKLQEHSVSCHPLSNTNNLRLSCYNRKTGALTGFTNVNLWSNQRNHELEFMNLSLAKIKASNYTTARISQEINHAHGNLFTKILNFKLTYFKNFRFTSCKK